MGKKTRYRKGRGEFSMATKQEIFRRIIYFHKLPPQQSLALGCHSVPGGVNLSVIDISSGLRISEHIPFPGIMTDDTSHGVLVGMREVFSL